MNLDGKLSQGIPIGNDISFLLAEVVLARVDGQLRLSHKRALRWYDDYELAFDSREEAEEVLKKLNRQLSRFRLRLNPKKTRIIRLPKPTQDEWQDELKELAAGLFRSVHKMIRYFDVAFRLREQFPDEPILMYALGILFKIASPSPHIARIAQSCITQAVLRSREPLRRPSRSYRFGI